MKARRLIAMAILVVPIIFVLLWHLCNHGLPNSDPANYAEISLRIAKNFSQHGLVSGMIAILDTRGWRPIAFPPLAVPFLLLTGNDVVAACAATLLAIYVGLVFYLYRLARLYSVDKLGTATACAFVLSAPAVAKYFLVFFSESAWLLCSVACVYHLLSGGPFKTTSHSAAAGLLGGLMLMLRPVESAIVLIVVLLFLTLPEIQAKRLAIRTCLITFGLFSIPIALLLISIRAKGITRFYIWAACLCTAALGALLARRINTAFVVFFGVLASMGCVWWAGFMPSLLEWVQVASAYSQMVDVTDMRSMGHIMQALRSQAADYGEIQIAVVVGLGIYLALSTLIRARSKKNHVDVHPAIAAPARLLSYACATMVVLFVALYSAGGSDPRRSLVAFALFATSVSVIAGTRSRLALAVVLCLTGLQFAVIGNTVAGIPRPSALTGLGPFPSPHRVSDGSLDAARALARYVSPGSNVAIYTLGTFQERVRIYDPAALKVACLQEDYGFDVGYLWNVADYDELITRLRQTNFRYLLLDSLTEVGSDVSRMPYIRLVAELQRRMQAGGGDTPGLRVIGRFQLGNRDQILFRVVPSSYDDSNLAAEFKGSRAIASDQQKDFSIFNLNDGTDAAWGSLEGNTDVYAGIVLPSPEAIQEVRLKLFTPNGRAHLRNIRIASADREGPRGPEWQFLRARLKGAGAFTNVITVPPLPDNSLVTIEIDRTDPQWHARPIWGFACQRSKGDLPNYLSAGTGVYLRELELSLPVGRRGLPPQ